MAARFLRPLFFTQVDSEKTSSRESVHERFVFFFYLSLYLPSEAFWCMGDLSFRRRVKGGLGDGAVEGQKMEIRGEMMV